MIDIATRRRSLGSLLRTIRRERGVTRIQLAERLDLRPSAILAYETECRLDFFEVKAVVDALGIDFDSFLDHMESTSEELSG